MTHTWRLIQTPPTTGAWNMALDESLLYHASQKISPPTLRFYSWSIPTLSLGYSQPCADVDMDRLDQIGWDLVRRPTGGRAILHTDEFTYSLTAPLDEPAVSGSLLESYQRLSNALQKGLSKLGVVTAADEKYTVSNQIPDKNPVCFRVPSNYEITWNKKKLIGSAQARKPAGVLQHGSLPLFGDLTRITQVLKYETEEGRESAAKGLLERATTLKEVTGEILPWQIISNAMLQAFSEELDIHFVEQPTEDFEHDYAQELLRTKYSTDQWNLRI